MSLFVHYKTKYTNTFFYVQDYIKAIGFPTES